MIILRYLPWLSKITFSYGLALVREMRKINVDILCGNKYLFMYSFFPWVVLMTEDGNRGNRETTMVLRTTNEKQTNTKHTSGCLLCRRKELFYLTTHSTHFIYGYMASDIW